MHHTYTHTHTQHQLTTPHTQREGRRTHTDTEMTGKHVLVSSLHWDKRDGGRVVFDCLIHRYEMNSCFIITQGEDGHMGYYWSKSSRTETCIRRINARDLRSQTLNRGGTWSMVHHQTAAARKPDWTKWSSSYLSESRNIKAVFPFSSVNLQHRNHTAKKKKKRFLRM